jgi:hypothetical protein
MTMAKLPRKRPVPAPPRQPDPDSDELRLLHPLAQQIRHAYITQYRVHYLARHGVPTDFGSRPMPRWDGGRAGDGRLYKPIWYEIARVAYARQISPEDMITAAFHGWDRKDPPWPSNLLSAEVIRRAEAHPGITAENLRQTLRSQRDIWRTETGIYAYLNKVDEEEAASRVLRNLRLELSAIFRYCMASLAGDVPVIEMFEVHALRQYAYSRRAYDKGWGELIPDRLRALADRLGAEGG